MSDSIDEYARQCRENSQERLHGELRKHARNEIVEKLKPLLRYPTPAIRKALKKIIDENSNEEAAREVGGALMAKTVSEEELEQWKAREVLKRVQAARDAAPELSFSEALCVVMIVDALVSVLSEGINVTNHF